VTTPTAIQGRGGTSGGRAPANNDPAPAVGRGKKSRPRKDALGRDRDRVHCTYCADRSTSPFALCTSTADCDGGQQRTLGNATVASRFVTIANTRSHQPPPRSGRSWEAQGSSAGQEIHWIFLEPESSSPRSQKPATCPYPEPYQSILRPPSRMNSAPF